MMFFHHPEGVPFEKEEIILRPHTAKTHVRCTEVVGSSVTHIVLVSFRKIVMSIVSGCFIRSHPCMITLIFHFFTAFSLFLLARGASIGSTLVDSGDLPNKSVTECRTKFSQENGKEFLFALTILWNDQVCEDHSWNHCTLTPHRSETK